jgi:hypothetical protein
VSRNLFGGAESIGASFAFGNRTKSAVEVKGKMRERKQPMANTYFFVMQGIFTTPLNGSPNVTLSAFVNQSIKDHSAINFYEEASKSAGVGIKVRVET